MPRAAVVVQPEASTDAEKLALLEEIAALKAQLAAAPVAPPVLAKAPAVAEAPKADTDPYGPLQIPRQMHGVWLRDPVEVQGKVYNPGSTYKTGFNGKPLTVGEARTIIAAASAAAWLIATKDEDHGKVISLGRFHGESE